MTEPNDSTRTTDPAPIRSSVSLDDGLTRRAALTALGFLLFGLSASKQHRKRIGTFAESQRLAQVDLSRRTASRDQYLCAVERSLRDRIAKCEQRGTDDDLEVRDLWLRELNRIGKLKEYDGPLYSMGPCQITRITGFSVQEPNCASFTIDVPNSLVDRYWPDAKSFPEWVGDNS